MNELPRVIKGLSEADYNELPGVRSSFLWATRRSVAHAMCDKPRTDALDFGVAFHAYCLNTVPEFEKMVYVYDKARKNSKDYKQAEENSGGRVMITREDLATIERMHAALNSHPIARLFLRGRNDWRELSLQWEEFQSGILCKARIDGIAPIPSDGGETLFAFDLKTCGDASGPTFSRDASKYGYHMRASMYLDGIKSCGIPAERFAFVAVEKTPPYGVNVWIFDDESMTAGDNRYRVLLMKYAESVKSETVTAYQQKTSESMMLSVPKWEIKEAQESWEMLNK